MGPLTLLYNKKTKTYKHSKGVKYDDGNDNFYNLKLINLVNNKIVLHYLHRNRRFREKRVNVEFI